jgi:gliding motility-associated-like protein
VTDPLFSGNLVFDWSGPAAFDVVDSTIVFQNATADINGVYSLTVSNENCISTASTIEIHVTDSPAAPVVTGENTYCTGDSIILMIESPIAGGLYTWTSNDTTLTVGDPGTFILPDATTDFTGLIRVEVSVNGCVSPSTPFALQIRPPLPPAVISGTSFVCEGDSLTLQTDIPAGALLTWTGPNGFMSQDEMPFIFPADASHSGTYSVLYELNGCTVTGASFFDVTVQPALTEPQIQADVTAICIDDPLPVTVCLQSGTSTPGGMYTWILDGNIVIGGPSPDSCLVINGSPLHSGINSISVISTLQGCPSDTSAVINIQGDQYPELMADAGEPMIYCPDDMIVLEGSDPAPGTGLWTSGDSIVIFENATDPHSGLLPLPSGMYTLTWTLSYATCPDYSSDDVEITVITVPVVFPDTVDVLFGQTAEFIVTLNDMLSTEPYTLQLAVPPQRGNTLHVGNGIFRYTPNLGFVGTDMFVYRICSTDCPEECSETTVVLYVGSESDCFVPSLFTPNGDGINDILIVPCLETSQFPQNRIIIFNEWGDAVFTAAPYFNDWDGTISGSPLPVGTYFYIMDFGDGQTPKRSFLVLER